MADVVFARFRASILRFLQALRHIAKLTLFIARIVHFETAIGTTLFRGVQGFHDEFLFLFQLDVAWSLSPRGHHLVTHTLIIRYQPHSLLDFLVVWHLDLPCTPTPILISGTPPNPPHHSTQRVSIAGLRRRFDPGGVVEVVVRDEVGEGRLGCGFGDLGLRALWMGRH